MIIIGFYKRFEDNKMFLTDFFSNIHSISVDVNDFGDDLFDVLCRVEEGQIIKVEYEEKDDMKKLTKLYFIK